MRNNMRIHPAFFALFIWICFFAVMYRTTPMVRSWINSPQIDRSVDITGKGVTYRYYIWRNGDIEESFYAYDTPVDKQDSVLEYLSRYSKYRLERNDSIHQMLKRIK